ncbi:MAG: triose-phosphate isomerase [Coprobacillus sp.]|nr:triose-phosphate isomerase [Coprobacillus sp.]
MRRKLLMGNWKMNKLNSEAKEFALSATKTVEKASANNIDIGVAPTYLSLHTVKQYASKDMIVCAQNVHYKESGAFTGEISADMLLEEGITWSLVGHSERSTYDNETDEKCNLKIKYLISKGMRPLYCVGETLQEFETGITKEIIKRQIQVGLLDINSEDAKNIVIAYEPVWSIGTGKNASSEIAEDVCKYIRGLLHDLFGDVSEDIRILYGGSVKPENIREYLECEDVDGALVGGASLKIESYEALLDNII